MNNDNCQLPKWRATMLDRHPTRTCRSTWRPAGSSWNSILRPSAIHLKARRSKSFVCVCVYPVNVAQRGSADGEMYKVESRGVGEGESGRKVKWERGKVRVSCSTIRITS